MSTPDPKRRALGRGLEALLPSRSAPAAPPEAAQQPSGRPLELEIGAIVRNPYQTRTDFDSDKLNELAKSIEAIGVVQPITVRTLKDGRYQLISGERRLLASLGAGRKTVPAIVHEVSDEQAMEMTIVENLQRADLNPMEQARAFHRLSTEFRMTQEQMSIRTGKERTSISNFLRLLRLPNDVQQKVETGQLSFGHARTLLAMTTPQQMRAVAERILAKGLSVRQTETFVQDLLAPEQKELKPTRVIEPRDPNVQEAQDLLQRNLGLRVRIEDKRGKGRVIIEYANVDDFDLLLLALGEDRKR